MSQKPTPNFTLRQYFTDAVDVNSAMCHLLGDVSGLEVLEPSVGSGSLLEGLLGSPARIDIVDIDAEVLPIAQSRSPGSLTVAHCADFIDIFAQGLLASTHSITERQFDAVISNPPFGLYLDLLYRRQLKKIYPDFYVRESYGLFFAFSISLLRQEGRYVFLLPDTFMVSKNHAPLRKFIYEKASPDTIIRFPSRRFETVNFGYGNLCIISGSRSAVTTDTRVTWIEAFNEEKSLLDQPAASISTLTGHELRENLNLGWRANMNITGLERQGWTQLGELADCKTGIYTGDNKRFIGYDPSRVNRRLNGHPVDWEPDVITRTLLPKERTQGLNEENKYVPLVRGGHRPFLEQTAWCIKWDKAAVDFYRTNKKARLQNASFYFRAGLAIPMVTSKRLTASLLDGAVFDQGVVGVFPKNETDRDALLLYLNSSIATKLRNHIVNGSANNSANYLKRLPVPIFHDADRVRARKLIDSAIQANQLAQELCDDFVNNLITMQDKKSDPWAEL